MASEPPFGGEPLIADTSAWSAIYRARQIDEVPPEWIAAIEAGQVATHPVVRIELLHSTRNLAQFDEWNERLSALREVQLTYSDCRAAIAALRELAEKGDGYHRVGLGDAMISASAQATGVGVLHYNHGDFEKLAEVLNFNQVPLAPRGTFEK